MEEKIAITCDSSLDLSPDLIKEYNIKVLSMVIKMDGAEYLDIEEAAPDDILGYHDRTGELAVTSAPTMQQTFQFFTRLVHMGYTVIHLCLSSGLSSAYENAVAAAETFRKVTVIDTKTASVGGGLLVIRAAEMLQEGKTASEIIEQIKRMIPKSQEPFLIDEMEFLYKGGRASMLATFMAGLFSIKPSLYVDMSDGTLKAGKKYRGKFDNIVPKFIEESLNGGKNIDKKHIMIGHTGLSNAFLQDCKTEIEKIADFENIHIVRAGCTITSHLGKNSLILAWIAKA